MTMPLSTSTGWQAPLRGSSRRSDRCAPDGPSSQPKHRDVPAHTRHRMAIRPGKARAPPRSVIIGGSITPTASHAPPGPSLVARRERPVLPAVTPAAAAHATACSWRIRFCAKSYCAWRRTQNAALLQPGRSSTSAIADEMPVRPFNSRDNVCRVHPSFDAASVTVQPSAASASRKALARMRRLVHRPSSSPTSITRCLTRDGGQVPVG